MSTNPFLSKLQIVSKKPKKSSNSHSSYLSRLKRSLSDPLKIQSLAGLCLRNHASKSFEIVYKNSALNWFVYLLNCHQAITAKLDVASAVTIAEICSTVPTFRLIPLYIPDKLPPRLFGFVQLFYVLAGKLSWPVALRIHDADEAEWVGAGIYKLVRLVRGDV